MNRYIKDLLFGAIDGVAGTFVFRKVMGAISQRRSEEDKKREKVLIEEPADHAATRKPGRTKPELREVS